MLNKPSRADELARMVREVLDGGGDRAEAAASRFIIADGRLYNDRPAERGERV
jgi:hypothetical protein